MKLNCETKIVGSKTILVPYRISHVEKYHRWMESEELRQQTASVRLTLEEEYNMQQTWFHDEEKCTFIVLDKEIMDKSENEVESMIGDVNLYLTKNEEDQLIGELSLMVAEPNYRNSGRGREAALHMMRYGVEKIGIKQFKAIISLDNSISLKLFYKLGFLKEAEALVFQEVTLSRNVDEEWKTWLERNTLSYELGTTEPNK